jgi:CheY-like chemotaxis protein
MTAHAMKGDRELCMASGMDGYLSKPIRLKDLLEALEKFARPVEWAHGLPSPEPLLALDLAGVAQ